MDNFNLKKFLSENKLTKVSRMLIEQEGPGSLAKLQQDVAAELDRQGIPYEVVSFMEMAQDLGFADNADPAEDTPVLRLEGASGNYIYVVEMGYGSLTLDGKDIEGEQIFRSAREVMNALKSHLGSGTINEAAENIDQLKATIKAAIQALDEDGIEPIGMRDLEGYTGEDVNIELYYDRGGSDAVFRYLEDYDDAEEFDDQAMNYNDDLIGYVRNGVFTPLM